MVHQITEVRLLIGLEVPSKYDLVASRKKNIRQEAVFILPLVPQAAWVSTLSTNNELEPFALQIFSASLAKKAAMYFAWSCLNKPACSDVYQFIRNMR